MARIANATTEVEDCEIEITSEMLASGRAVITQFWGELAADPTPALFEEVARSVFLEMRLAREL